MLSAVVAAGITAIGAAFPGGGFIFIADLAEDEIEQIEHTSAAVLCRHRAWKGFTKFHHRFGRNTDYFHAAWSPRLRGMDICP